MFAALNTVEPPISLLATADLVQNDPDWARLFRAKAVASVDERLSRLDEWLGGRDYLIGRFSCADILMKTVLRLLRHTEIVDGHPAVAAYVERCQARPAFKEALGEQMCGYAASAPAAA